MREPPDAIGGVSVNPSDDDSIDRAYRAALAAAPEADEPEHALRRRDAVLAAVMAIAPTVQPDKRSLAANDPRWHASAAVWRGVAAACVLVASSLVVTHLLDEGAGDASFKSPAVLAARPESNPPAAALPSPSPSLAAEPLARSVQAARAERQSAAGMRPPMPPAAPPAKSAVVRDARPMQDRSTVAAPPLAKGQAAPATSANGPANLEPAHAPTQAAIPSAAARADSGPTAPRQAADMASADRAANVRAEESKAEASGNVSAQRRVAEAQAAPRAATKAAVLPNTTPNTAPNTPPDTESRRTPNDSLLAAVARGDVESARQWLTVAGPDTQHDGDGRSALTLAVLRSDLPMVRLLLAQGASRLALDRFGQTPQGYAAAHADPALRAAFDLP